MALPFSSSAEDVAIYAQMMLGRGEYGGVRVLSPQTVARMTRGDRVSSGVRGLGWDKRTGFSTNRGELLSDSAFGHGSFTGTVLWIDPDLDLFFLTEQFGGKKGTDKVAEEHAENSGGKNRQQQDQGSSQQHGEHVL